MAVFFDDDVTPPDQPFSVFDRHALFLVRVPHGVPIVTNGTVIAEYAPIRSKSYIDMLIDRVLREQSGK
jgi:hypothetical protein